MRGSFIMTKETLYDYLEKKATFLQKQGQPEKDENIEFIRSFLAKNNIKNPWVCKDIDEDELFYWAMSVMTYFDKTPLSQQLYTLNSDFFKKSAGQKICTVANLLEIINIKSQAESEKGNIDITNPADLQKELDKIKELTTGIIETDDIDFTRTLITLKLTKDEQFDQCIFYIIQLQEFKKSIEKLRNKIASREEFVSFGVDKAQDIILKKKISLLYNNFYLDDWADRFYQRFEQINDDFNKREKKKKAALKEANLYIRLKQQLPIVLAQDEITDYKSLVEGMDEDIKVAVLSLVYEHNQQIYQTVEENYVATQANDRIRYQLLLKKYGIEETNCLSEKILKHSLVETDLILNRLTSLGIKDSKALVEILKVISIKSLDNLSKYLKKGIIKKSFAENNPSIFDMSSNIYINAITNINTFIERGITPNYIKENQDVLLISSDILKKSIDILEEYDLKISLTPKTLPIVLAQEHLEEKLDTIIEQGYEEVLKNNLSLAAYSKQEWKKIELLRQMNIEVEEEDLEEILSTKTFIVGEEEIDSYITNALSIEENEQLNALKIEEKDIYDPLEEYASSKLAYNIGSITVSRKKVQRNLRKLSNLAMSDENKILLSIGNNMSLTNDEFITMKNTLGLSCKNNL